jgi:hypothetical protein
MPATNVEASGKIPNKRSRVEEREGQIEQKKLRREGKRWGRE